MEVCKILISDVSPELASLVGVVDIGDDDAVRDECVEHVLAKSSD